MQKSDRTRSVEWKRLKNMMSIIPQSAMHFNSSALNDSYRVLHDKYIWVLFAKITLVSYAA